MPGACTVHHLPLSGWLLSVEHRAGPARPPGTAGVAGIGDFDPARQIEAQLESAPAETSPGTERASTLDALAQAHGFSRQALEADRAGRQGEGQSLRLLRSALFQGGAVDRAGMRTDANGQHFPQVHPRRPPAVDLSLSPSTQRGGEKQ